MFWVYVNFFWIFVSFSCDFFIERNFDALMMFVESGFVSICCVKLLNQV